MKKLKISWNIVIISSLVTALLIILFVGFLITEKNAQKIGFTNSEPFFSISNDKAQKFIQLKYMGNFFKIDFYPLYTITDKISKFVCESLHQAKESLFTLFSS